MILRGNSPMKNFRRLASRWGLLFLILLITVEPVSARVVVKMATLAPKNSTWHKILEDLSSKWKEISGGEVELRIYAGGVAGDDRDVVRKMRLGTLNGAVLTAVGVSEIEKSVFALEVPMMYASYEEVYYVLEKMRPGLENAIAAKGFVALNWADGGWIHYFTSRPVATPSDLMKEKLFSWAGDEAADQLVKSAGFNPVPLPATELATALQTGLVTAVGVSPQVAILSQYYRHVPHMTDVKWQLLLGATVITRKTWDEIPASLRPALMKAAADAGQKLRNTSRNSYTSNISAMKTRGLTVVPVNDADRAKWVRIAESTYPGIRGTIVPAAAFDEALRHRGDYRKGARASATIPR